MSSSNVSVTEEHIEDANEIVSNCKEGIKISTVPYGDNAYDYLNREGFTSEKYKIEIRGLPKFYGINEFKKLLNEKLSLDCAKLKTIRPGNSWAFVCFRNELDRAKAISVINGYKWKGKTLTAHEAKPAPDPLVKKRKQMSANNDIDSKKAKEDISQDEKLKNSTTPYWNITYEEQLSLKQNEIKNILKQYNNQLWKWAQPSLKLWMNEQKKQYNGLICELLEINPSPIIKGYRNKCEFTIGIDCETNLPTVGFRLSSYDAGFIGVGPVGQLNHISEKMKVAVEAFQKFIRNSKLTVFSPEDHSGYFKQLTARFSHYTAELMLIVGIHPQNMTEIELQQFKEDLKIFFSTGEGAHISVNSLYLQCITKRTTGECATPAVHIMGNTHITDDINGLKYRISPEAFFQVNTPCAEVLYNQAIKISQPTTETTLLDVCCGTGTIGLSFSKYCKRIIGLEIVHQAVEDAKYNAKFNEITNAEFHAGPAEDLLSSILWAVKGEKDLLAVVDPPRAGLHTRAITQLRRCTELKRLVYIACCPRSALKNWVDLARPTSKTMRGDPFRPVRAVAVDMFPQTKHCEFLMYFERTAKLQPPALATDLKLSSVTETPYEVAISLDERIKTETEVARGSDELENKELTLVQDKTESLPIETSKAV